MKCASRGQKQTEFAVLPRRGLSERRFVLREVRKPRAEPNLFGFCRGGVSTAQSKYDFLLSVRGRRRMRRPPVAGRCSPPHGAAAGCRSSGFDRRANLSKLYFGRPPICGIALRKQPDSHFGKYPVSSIRFFLRGAGLPPFVTERWCQKCPQGTFVGIGRRFSLSGHKRLRCFAHPLRALEPPSDLFPPPVQCGDYCALRATMIIWLRSVLAGRRSSGAMGAVFRIKLKPILSSVSAVRKEERFFPFGCRRW